LIVEFSLLLPQEHFCRVDGDFNYVTIILVDFKFDLAAIIWLVLVMRLKFLARVVTPNLKEDFVKIIDHPIISCLPRSLEYSPLFFLRVNLIINQRVILFSDLNCGIRHLCPVVFLPRDSLLKIYPDDSEVIHPYNAKFGEGVYTGLLV
jgi:hypothetical protein